MRTRLGICARKRRFAAGEAAQAASLATAFTLRAYRCDRCDQYHLTSRRKGKRIPRPVIQGTA